MYTEIEINPYKHQKISMKDIEDFENRYSILLPEVYKLFLLQYNGSNLKEQFLYMSKRKKFYTTYITFSNFEELCHSQTLVESMKNTDFDENNPGFYCHLKKKMLRIGSTNSQILCLCYDKRNYGKIYYIDEPHENEFHLLANSFDEFMNGFEINPDYE